LPFFAILFFRLALGRNFYVTRVYNLAESIGAEKIIWNNPFVTAAYSIFTNFSLIIWPSHLTLYHSPYVIHPIAQKTYVILLFVLLGALPFIFKKSKELFLGIMIFILYLIPTYSPVTVCCIVAERYLYFPSVILSIILAVVYQRYVVPRSKSRFLGMVLAGIFIVPYAGRTVVRNEDWKTPERFWRATLLASPHNYQVHVRIAEVYRQEGNYQAALKEFKQALKIQPNDPVLLNNLGITFASMNEYDEAVSTFQKLVTAHPDFAEGYFNLGNLYLETQRYDAAMDAYRAALKVNPRCVECYVNVGRLNEATGKTQEAIQSYEEALKINPSLGLAYNNLAVLYFKLGFYPQAVKQCDMALRYGYRVHPDFRAKIDAVREMTP
jgi:tetratricopeptide (TPR) repeat protein